MQLQFWNNKKNKVWIFLFPLKDAIFLSCWPSFYISPMNPLTPGRMAFHISHLDWLFKGRHVVNNAFFAEAWLDMSWTTTVKRREVINHRWKMTKVGGRLTLCNHRHCLVWQIYSFYNFQDENALRNWLPSKELLATITSTFRCDVHEGN